MSQHTFLPTSSSVLTSAEGPGNESCLFSTTSGSCSSRLCRFFLWRQCPVFHPNLLCSRKPMLWARTHPLYWVLDDVFHHTLPYSWHIPSQADQLLLFSTLSPPFLHLTLRLHFFLNQRFISICSAGCFFQFSVIKFGSNSSPAPCHWARHFSDSSQAG